MTEGQITAIQQKLAEFYEELLEKCGDSTEVRQVIVNYTLGYMNASFGITVK